MIDSRSWINLTQILMTPTKRRQLMTKIVKQNFLFSDLYLIDRMIEEGLYDRTSRQSALQTIWGVRRAVAVGKELKAGATFNWHNEAPPYIDPPTQINYVKGDATDPIRSAGNTVIVHCCNDVGGWGAGFVMALSARWKAPEEQYRDRCNAASVSGGYVQIIPVEPGLLVANVIGQHGVRDPDRPSYVPVRYNWLEAGFAYLGAVAGRLNVTGWAMPRLGCGLAGGEWQDVQRIVARRLPSNVTVYDIP